MSLNTDQTVQLRALVAEISTASKIDQLSVFAKFVGLILTAQSRSAKRLTNLDQAHILRLLDVEAFETLIISMIGDRWGFMQSAAPNGVSLATVWNPVSRDEFEFEASTPGLAILGALAMMLMADEAHHVEDSFAPLRWQHTN